MNIIRLNRQQRGVNRLLLLVQAIINHVGVGFEMSRDIMVEQTRNQKTFGWHCRFLQRMLCCLVKRENYHDTITDEEFSPPSVMGNGESRHRGP